MSPTRLSAIFAVLYLSGAGIAAASPPVDPPKKETSGPAQAPLARNAKINWAAARADQANSAALATGVDISVPEGRNTAWRVPVLVPAHVVQRSKAPRPVLLSTPDGYFVTFKLARFELIVNGSMRSYQTGDASRGSKTDLKFSLGEGGALLAFSRYGADYALEFECSETAVKACVSEDEAKDIGEQLIVWLTR